jgi:hypothetical protein
MFERFRPDARRAIVLATEEAQRLGQPHIGPEHLLIGLAGLPEGAGQVLAAFDVSREAVRSELMDIVGSHNKDPAARHLPFLASTKRILEGGLREAQRTGDTEVGSGSLLLSLIRDSDGLVMQLLARLGVSPEAVRARTVELGEPESGSSPPGPLLRQGVHRPPRRTPTMPALRPPLTAVSCSFCRRSPPASGPLVAAPMAGPAGVYICGDCATSAGDVLEAASEARAASDDRPPKVWVVDPGTLHAAPAVTWKEAQAAEVAIRAAVEHLDDVSDDGLALPNVEHGSNLGPILAEAGRRAPGSGKATFRLDGVTVVSLDMASIAFTVMLASGPSFAQAGVAVKVGEQWNVSRDTFCQLVGRAGVQCPPLAD